MRRIARAGLASLVLLLPLSVHAQDTGPAPATAAAPAPAPVPATYVYVALTTSQGVITLALDKTHAPLTVANFLKYVDTKRLDGTTFYRAMHLDWGTTPTGLLQGGLQGLPGKVLPPVAHEPTNVTGLSHTSGTISMARYAPGTATADFTIMIGDVVTLDANPAATDPDTRAGFAAFGHVVAGMDVVKAIWNAPLSATKGEGVMRGQMLEPPVKILTARRTSAPPTAAVPASASVPAPASAPNAAP
ncbi:peptidylprolyl isomerase [Novosphingobium sp. Leaf2]|uniref:peptidylprolyl isomerase n=1 Tax=Novosphingobium sp. Leaf2 TaxID=1735670 RepID=UPI0006F5FC1F|nr:peptidylprolyl isomerase [Novosphingobium sp. Leaf2]KQM22271.1 peptidylprolyl isomerase [Novosphingobium sp. Leaf2]